MDKPITDLTITKTIDGYIYTIVMVHDGVTTKIQYGEIDSVTLDKKDLDSFDILG